MGLQLFPLSQIILSFCSRLEYLSEPFLFLGNFYEFSIGFDNIDSKKKKEKKPVIRQNYEQ